MAVVLSATNGFIGGVVAHQRDTAFFYYPLFAWAAQQLREGRFPLWCPEILGGYPIFADSELGLAAPLVLLGLLTLPPDVAFVALRLVHVAVAAVGTYALARAWRLPRAAATLAGLTFALGSFLQAHLHHENIVRTAAWLPLMLACLEQSLRSDGRARPRWIVAAGASLGLASVGLHPQVLLVNVLTLGAYGILRGWVEGNATARRALVIRAQVAIVCVVALGLSLAAAQLVPLAELAPYSARMGNSFLYSEIAGQSLTPYGLIQLVLPFVFRDAHLRQWGLWTHWESYLYVGLAPLVLALVALGWIRNRKVAFWVVLGSGGLLLALGPYAPLDGFSLMQSAPGLSWLRAPGRFALVVDLALAMLAAHGVHLLQAKARRPAPPRLSWRPAVPALLLPAVFVTSIVSIRRAMVEAPDVAQRLIETHYLSLPRDSRWMTAADVYGGVLWATDVENPRTLGAAVGLSLVALILVTWQATPWTRARRWRGWPWLLVVSAAVDLLVFSWSLHPREALSTLARPHSTALAVRELVGRVDAWQGPVRTFASPVLQQVASDRLAPLGLQEAGGYSSLDPSRHRGYLRRVQQVDDELLDLLGVRYVFDPAQYGALATYGDVQYLPANALLRAAAHTDLGKESLRIPAGFSPAEIRLVSALVGAAEVGQDQAIATITLRSDTSQVVAQAVLRAGRDTMDWSWDDLAPTAGARHARAEVAGEFQERIASGQVARRLLSYARVVLDQPATAHTLEITSLTPRGELVIYGLALVDRQGQVHQLFGRVHKSKYREVFRADGIMVLENVAAFPRAFMVQNARLVPDGASLDVMERQAFTPREEVVLAAETPPLAERQPFASTPGRAAPPLPGQVWMQRYGPQEVTLHVASPRGGFLVLSDSFYPGWRAYVDGVERPILRGNLLFRVVQVPDGSHEVVFLFQPLSVLLGLGISIAAALAAVGVLVATVACESRLVRKRELGRMEQTRALTWSQVVT
jgi:hypothetical protein